MKKLFFAAALIALTGATASAKDVYFFKDKAADSFLNVSDVTRLTFSATSIELTGANGVTEVPYTDFSAFAFSDKRTVGVKPLSLDKQGIRFTDDSKGNVALKSDGLIETIAVYSASGMLVAEYFPGASNFEFSVAGSGIYLVKVESGSNKGVFKIVKR